MSELDTSVTLCEISFIHQELHPLICTLGAELWSKSIFSEWCPMLPNVKEHVMKGHLM